MTIGVDIQLRLRGVLVLLRTYVLTGHVLKVDSLRTGAVILEKVW